MHNNFLALVSSQVREVVKINGSVINTVLTPLLLKSEIICFGFGKLSLWNSKFPKVPWMVVPNQYKSKTMASNGMLSALNFDTTDRASCSEWYPKRLAKLPKVQRGGRGCLPVKLVYDITNSFQLSAAIT